MPALTDAKTTPDVSGSRLKFKAHVLSPHPPPAAAAASSSSSSSTSSPKASSSSTAADIALPYACDDEKGLAV